MAVQHYHRQCKFDLMTRLCNTVRTLIYIGQILHSLFISVVTESLYTARRTVTYLAASHTEYDRGVYNRSVNHV